MMNSKILLPKKKRNTHKLWRDLKTLNLKSSSLVTIQMSKKNKFKQTVMKI